MMKTPGRYLQSLIIPALITAAILSVASRASANLLDDFVKETLTDTDGYKTSIETHLAKSRANQPVTSAERIAFSDAYTYYAWSYLRSNNAQNAVHAITEALKLNPSNPNALVVAGILSAMRKDYAGALGYLRGAAASKDDAATKYARIAADEIASSLLAQAKALAGEKRYIDANTRLVFIIRNYEGEPAGQALTLQKEYGDEVTALKMLVQAQELLRLRRRGDAQRLLKQLTTTYSWTDAAEEAQKILRQSDDLIVKAEGDSVFSEFAASQKWKLLETENFRIYYRNNEYAKEAAKTIEDTFRKTVRELDMKNVSWRASKCNIFLFDDRDAWNRFISAMPGVSEWAAAFAVPGKREIFGNASEGRRLVLETLPHEITHLIHGEYLGERSVPPPWLSEGLAVHQQVTGKLQNYHLVAQAIEQGAAIPLADLTRFRTYPSSGIALFYASSMALVEFIIENYGIDAFVKINRNFKGGSDWDLDFGKICSRYLKDKPDAVEAKWRDFVNRKARGTSGQ